MTEQEWLDLTVRRQKELGAMPTGDHRTWAYHNDFAELLIGKDHTVALRMLQTADIALTFARALVAKDYWRANAMLSTASKLSFPPEALREKLEDMIDYSGDEVNWPTNVHVVTGIDASEQGSWSPMDFGWTYVSIDGIHYCEAVAVRVTNEGDRLSIREIEWGRP